ncbi:MAG: copper chaperone Copz family protein [Ignavibacteriae bacterium]|nr:copper chaperone Copz family protein [Ignavibacteria bacterium]MBI3365808.1 copper chaperone Copz family protein [Ignavibacteriota bacterium]
MNSCCALPVEVIAADKHKSGDACCLVTEKTPTPARAECPVSKTSSRKVQRRTLEHLLKAEKVGSIQNVQYYYCTDPECKCVYFSNERMPYFTVDDVNVKVFAKDKGDDVNVCYCFEWTRGRIEDELNQTGKSTASLQIAQQVKVGNCACNIKNPKGECCLGDVNTVVKQAAQPA